MSLECEVNGVKIGLVGGLAVNAYHFGIFLYNLNNYTGKMKCVNYPKLSTKISGLNLHQMVHLSGKNIFSPIVSKNLSGVPVRLSIRCLVRSIT
jgi:hypothetical protein